MYPTVILGADIGQQVDPTAIVVAELEDRLLRPGDALCNEAPVFETHFHVRHLERLPLGTSYPEVVREITRTARRLFDRHTDGAYYCLIDATGVGKPVADHVRDTIVPAWHVTAVTITGGAKGDDSLWFRTATTVGKGFLISRLQMLMQSKRVHTPPSAALDAMVAELLAFEVTISPSGHDTYSAPETVGAHDDTITALALCCCSDLMRVTYGPRVDSLPSPRL